MDLCIQHAARCVGNIQDYTKTEFYSTWYRTFVVVVYGKQNLNESNEISEVI